MKRGEAVLVIGGGIAGIQASLDLADRGTIVYLVEKTPSIGGRMAQLDKTFPTMDCSMCILAPKMIDCDRHPNIKLLTYSEVEEISGSAGDFTAKVLKKPRFVNEEKCTGCGVCAQYCPIQVPNEFNAGLGIRKAIYVPFPQAVPLIYTIDDENCIKCELCQRVCQPDAVDLDQKPEEITLNVSAIIIATGYDLFDPSAIKEYGYGKYKNVITAMEYERFINAAGPTGGELIRPSDGRIPRRVAFIQCVGSRSQRKERGFPYCSSACCMYATKEAVLLREHELDSEVCIFYIDLKVFGKGFQDFVNRAKENWGVRYIRGRPSEIREDPRTKDLTIWYEDTESGKIGDFKADLVVLCMALIPRPDNKKLADIPGLELDEYGFFQPLDSIYAPVDTGVKGVFICGYCQGPKDIPESIAQASGAAAKATEIITSTLHKEGE